MTPPNRKETRDDIPIERFRDRNIFTAYYIAFGVGTIRDYDRGDDIIHRAPIKLCVLLIRE